MGHGKKVEQCLVGYTCIWAEREMERGQVCSHTVHGGAVSVCVSLDHGDKVVQGPDGTLASVPNEKRIVVEFPIILWCRPRLFFPRATGRRSSSAYLVPLAPVPDER